MGLITIVFALGCQSVLHGPQIAPLAAAPPPESSIEVAALNADWTWEQIVDVVDDYFLIERERQVHVQQDLVTEGRIETLPQIGATAVEPHRNDSVGSYNCWEATLQTVRRRAELRVIPLAAGPAGQKYQVTAIVHKELEDLPRPEHATTGVATFRNDNSLDGHGDAIVSRTELSPYWIDLGRDVALERQILAEIESRLAPAESY